MNYESSDSQICRLAGLSAAGRDIISPSPSMLRLFRERARAYQPEGLAHETGDPNVALDNINRLRRAGLVIWQILVRPSGALFLFSNGEQYYTPALRVGGDGRETEILAELAAESGWGDLTELLDCYHAIPEDYEGPLPDLLPDDHDDLRGCRYPLSSGRAASRHAHEHN